MGSRLSHSLFYRFVKFEILGGIPPILVFKNRQYNSAYLGRILPILSNNLYTYGVILYVLKEVILFFLRLLLLSIEIALGKYKLGVKNFKFAMTLFTENFWQSFSTSVIWFLYNFKRSKFRFFARIIFTETDDVMGVYGNFFCSFWVFKKFTVNVILKHAVRNYFRSCDFW